MGRPRNWALLPYETSLMCAVNLGCGRSSTVSFLKFRGLRRRRVAHLRFSQWSGCHEGTIMRRSLSEFLNYLRNAATTVRFHSSLIPSFFPSFFVLFVSYTQQRRTWNEAVMSMAQTGGRQESEDTSREAENDREDSLESTSNQNSPKKQRGRSWGDSRSSLGLYIPLAPITIERRTQQNLLLATVHRNSNFHN